MGKSVCQVEEDGKVCGNPTRARDMCSMHYQRWQKYGDPLTVKIGQPRGTCAIEDHGRVCARPVVSREWCGTHYMRWLKHGDPHYTERPMLGLSDADRFFCKVDADGDCWEWTGRRDPGGYGCFDVWEGGDSHSLKAHRWVWQHLVGDVPERLELDHLCRNRACVNPDHLELVERAENIRRSASSAGLRYRERLRRERALTGSSFGHAHPETPPK